MCCASPFISKFNNAAQKVDNTLSRKFAKHGAKTLQRITISALRFGGARLLAVCRCRLASIIICDVRGVDRQKGAIKIRFKKKKDASYTVATMYATHTHTH